MLSTATSNRWILGKPKRHVASCRPELYLDGPEYILWTFRNRILQEREGRLYVGYIRTDEGNHWNPPACELEILGDAAKPLDSEVLRLIGAFQKLGMSTPESLSVVAHIWRSVQITDELHISELEGITERTLNELDQKGLLNKDNEAMSIVIDRWLYPLYPLDLGLLKVERNALRQAQRAEADRFYEQF